MNILFKGVIIVNTMMLIFCNSLFAQDFKVLSFSKRPTELQVLNRTFFISEVIDARNVPSRYHIGYVQTGLSNMKCEAVFEKNANQAIAEYLKIAFPYYPKMDSIILKINRLNVSEKTAMATETAFLTAEFDFIRKTPQGYFLIDKQNIDYSERSMGDVTKKHIPNIEMALEEAFKKFHSKRRWALPIDSLLALSQADLRHISKAAILTDSILKEGVYKSFSDFRDNNPTMPYAFEKNDKGDKLLLITDEKGKKRRMKSRDEIWGFYDGEKFYIHQNGDFYPLYFKGEKTFFKGIDTQRRDKNMNTGAALFGLIGVAIASTTGVDEVIYELDLETGYAIIRERLGKR